MGDRPVRILLVEDEEAHAELVQRAFERAGGHQLAVTETVAAARKALRSPARRPDLVFADLNLPDGSGTELLALGLDLAIIVITSHGDESAAVEAMKAGALDYIVKSPDMLADLPHVAERSLREWRLRAEQRRLEAALAERERLASIGMATSILAHEIGNPLNNMFLSAQMLERKARKLDVDESLTAGLSTMTSEIRRLANLLREFRSFSRRDRLDLQPTDLGALVAYVVEATHVAAAHVRVERDLPTDLLVRGDPAKLTQVFTNLCSNAFEAMPDGGTLTVRGIPEREGTRVVVEITDTGCGIPPDVDVFEPFRTTKAQGTGLGLAVVRQIVASHAGTITYDSTPGAGTTFRVALPLALTDTAPPPSTRSG